MNSKIKQGVKFQQTSITRQASVFRQDSGDEKILAVLQARKLKKIKSFSDDELESSFKSLVKKENEILSDIILHIKEVEVRKLYLKKNFGSLFLYLTQQMGYANGPAQRRIDAARLSVEVPGLIENIKSGELNLSQVSLVQQVIRQKQIELTKQNLKSGCKKSVKIPTESKIELFESIKGKSVAETEFMVSKALEIEIKTKPKVIKQADESIRLEVTFTKEQWEKLERMKSLVSHSVPNGSWDQVFEHVADKVIASKTKTRSSHEQMNGRNILHSASENLNEELKKHGMEGNTLSKENKLDGKESKDTCKENMSDGMESKDPSKEIKLLKKKLEVPSAGTGIFRKEPNSESFYQSRKLLLSKYTTCQHVDKRTNQKCTSIWKLQTDHIIPKWAGGLGTPENLQVLCAQHNRWRYRKQAGIKQT